MLRNLPRKYVWKQLRCYTNGINVGFVVNVTPTRWEKTSWAARLDGKRAEYQL